MSIREEILALKPLEKLQLIDELLLSLDQPSYDIDEIWADEVEKRIDAYDRGEVKAIDAKDVFAKYGL